MMKGMSGIELRSFYHTLSGLSNIYESVSQGFAQRLLVSLRWSLSTHLATTKKTRPGLRFKIQKTLSNNRIDQCFIGTYIFLRKMKMISTFSLSIMTLLSCQTEKYMDEIQITHDLSYNHDLDNNDNFSPDDQWLVYDTRTEAGGIGANGKIEKVNVSTGEKVVLYELPHNRDFGPGAGAVSYSHAESKVVFIHGLLSAKEENPYQQWRRSGVIIDDSNPGVPIFMDARNISEPFTPGALRGGTHRHEWSGDGQWIGYTYNDAILKQLEDETGEIHNLRTDRKSVV